MELITMQDAEIAMLTSRLESICVSTKNITALEEIRAETNKKLKEAKDAISAAEKEYLKPFDEMRKAALAKLEPLEKATKKFSADILEAKKTAFREKVEEEWKILSTMNEEGLVAPFEEVYDPSWYGMAEKDWKPLLIKAIKRHLTKDDEATVYLKLYCSKQEASQVENYLIENKITYEKEIL